MTQTVSDDSLTYSLRVNSKAKVSYKKNCGMLSWSFSPKILYWIDLR